MIKHKMGRMGYRAAGRAERSRGRARLTDEAKEAMRESLLAGAKPSEVAQLYGISSASVYEVLRPVRRERARAKLKARAKRIAEEKAYIPRVRSGEMTLTDVARHFGVRLSDLHIGAFLLSDEEEEALIQAVKAGEWLFMAARRFGVPWRRALYICKQDEELAKRDFGGEGAREIYDALLELPVSRRSVTDVAAGMGIDRTRAMNLWTKHVIPMLEREGLPNPLNRAHYEMLRNSPEIKAEMQAALDSGMRGYEVAERYHIPLEHLNKIVQVKRHLLELEDGTLASLEQRIEIAREMFDSGSGLQEVKAKTRLNLSTIRKYFPHHTALPDHVVTRLRNGEPAHVVAWSENIRSDIVVACAQELMPDVCQIDRFCRAAFDALTTLGGTEGASKAMQTTRENMANIWSRYGRSWCERNGLKDPVRRQKRIGASTEKILAIIESVRQVGTIRAASVVVGEKEHHIRKVWHTCVVPYMDKHGIDDPLCDTSKRKQGKLV